MVQRDYWSKTRHIKETSRNQSVNWSNKDMALLQRRSWVCLKGYSANITLLFSQWKGLQSHWAKRPQAQTHDRMPYCYYFHTPETTELAWTCLFKFLSADQNMPSWYYMSLGRDLLHHKPASPLIITKCPLPLPLSVSLLPMITFTSIQSVDQMNALYLPDGVYPFKDKRTTIQTSNR